MAQVKARIWPRLFYVCRIRSTAVEPLLLRSADPGPCLHGRQRGERRKSPLFSGPARMGPETFHVSSRALYNMERSPVLLGAELFSVSGRVLLQQNAGSKSKFAYRAWYLLTKGLSAPAAIVGQPNRWEGDLICKHS